MMNDESGIAAAWAALCVFVIYHQRKAEGFANHSSFVILRFQKSRLPINFWHPLLQQNNFLKMQRHMPIRKQPAVRP